MKSCCSELLLDTTNKLNNRHFLLGPPPERQRLQAQFTLRQERHRCHNLVVVASYDLVRNDIDFFSAIRWNYVILDEGHVIKNNKTKVCLLIR